VGGPPEPAQGGQLGAVEGAQAVGRGVEGPLSVTSRRGSLRRKMLATSAGPRRVLMPEVMAPRRMAAR
jgi:hypothetical protein